MNFLKSRNMIKAMTLLNLTLFPSDGSRSNPSEADQNKVLFYYSKGPCSGKHPKFDLWIFEDGRVIYKEVYQLRDFGEIRILLSKEDLDDFIKLLENGSRYHIQGKNDRDLPITTLKYKGKELAFYAPTVDGPLKEIDTKIEGLLENY